VDQRYDSLPQPVKEKPMTTDLRTPPAGLSRRRFLTATAAGTASAALLPLLGSSSRAQEVSPRGFRFVFMPCIHLRRDLRSPEGFANALQAVSKLSPAPDFILTGGDMCQNMRDQTLEQSEEITELFLKIYRENCTLPVHHCLGNHDLAAWNKVAESANDSRYGKNLTLRKFGMKDRYYSFDHAGWHFVALDYMRVTEPGRFTAEIDGEQMQWLGEDLVRNKARPAIVVTHAPVVSAVELFSDRAKRTEEALAVPFGRVISNAPDLVETAKGGNVRAFISGHLHLVERLELLGQTFICSGSASGQQWNGPRMGTPEGFGVFDCRADGTFDFRYQSHGWKA
jgi:3',5'-cyclic AMP phosphodiesterase CpdA